jgi:hypothetical protein
VTGYQDNWVWKANRGCREERSAEYVGPDIW